VKRLLILGVVGLLLLAAALGINFMLDRTDQAPAVTAAPAPGATPGQPSPGQPSPGQPVGTGASGLCASQPALSRLWGSQLLMAAWSDSQSPVAYDSRRSRVNAGDLRAWHWV
jgi:hypothetical protein